jgi:DNA polymerase I-like protein with 3'-5' exonuclease and polymerase domains
VAEAVAAGAGFRLSGAGVVLSRRDALSDYLVQELRCRREAVWNHLGGTALDRPSLGLLDQLGVEVVVPQDEPEALSLIAEMEADADLAAQMLSDARRPASLLGFDIETTALPDEETRPAIALIRGGAPAAHQPGLRGGASLDPRRATARLAQLYGGGARCLVLDTDLVPLTVLAPVLSRRTTVCHNAKFELAFLAQAGIAMPKFECTMQAAGLLLGTQRRGLDDAASAYLGIDLPKELQTSDWGAAVLSDGQLAYAALDAIVALRAWRKMRRELHEKRRGGAYVLQRDVTPVVARMEARGVLFDLVEHRRQMAEWGLALADARQALVKLTGQPPPATPNKVRELLSTALTPAQLTRWPRTATGQLSIKRADLLRIAPTTPVVAQVLVVQANEKLLNSFGDRLAAKVSPVTGRLHAGFNIASTKTGRFSSSNPNLQQIPARRAVGFRACFAAAPGHVFVVGDYSTMELRAVAEIADDTVLRADFANGVDLHRMQAAAMHNIDPADVTDAQRNAAKPINFGTIYGSGGAGLAASAWIGHGIVMSEDEATRARDKFLARYPALASWMRTHADRCQRNGFIAIGKLGRVIEVAWEAPKSGGQASGPLLDDDGENAAAAEDGDLDSDDPRSFFGFSRSGTQRSRLRYTLSCNAPIQGACADVIMLAMIAIDRAMRDANIDGGLVLSVHDELVIEVVADRADEAAALLQRCMEQAFAAVFPKAPLNGLVKLGRGRTWGETKR